MPKYEVFVEPTDVEHAPYINGTLEIHKVIRKKTQQGVNYLEFFRLSLDEKPFYTQYYRTSKDPIVCGHKSFDGGSNYCTQCLSVFEEGEEWMECPICKQWYCGEHCFLL